MATGQAVKTKGSHMSQVKTYELVAIFDPNVEAEQIETDLRKIYDLVVGQGGKFRRWERWGKRRLTYEIKHRQYGVYVLTVYDLATSATHELDRHLHLSMSLLRHLITVVDPDRVPDVDEESIGSLGAVKQEVESVEAVVAGEASVVAADAAVPDDVVIEAEIEAEKPA